MSNAAVMYINLADAGVVTASSSITTAPATTLQDPHVQRRWRSGVGDTAYVLVDLGALHSIDVVALFGITSVSSTGTTRVRISTADSTGVAGNAYDSSATVGAVNQEFDCLIKLLATPVTGRYVRIDLFQTGALYHEAGRFVVGLREQFDFNFSAGWSRQIVDRSRKTEGRGGQQFIDFDISYRVVEVTFEHVIEEQRYGVVEAIDLINGWSTDILLITDPASDDIGRDSIWGLVEDVTAVTQQFILDPPVFNKTYRIRERL